MLNIVKSFGFGFGVGVGVGVGIFRYLCRVQGADPAALRCNLFI
jgi:hypothetical protein